MQAAEALKILAGRRDKINRRITAYDLWENRREGFDLPARNPQCACCGQRQFEYLEGTRGADAMTLCGRNSVQICQRAQTRVDLDALARRLAPLGALEKNRFLLRANIDDYQLTIFANGRAIISGTYDLAVAKSLYSRYVGA
jgi:adenylyltransferase/sulfurtransferase